MSPCLLGRGPRFWEQAARRRGPACPALPFEALSPNISAARLSATATLSRAYNTLAPALHPVDGRPIRLRLPRPASGADGRCRGAGPLEASVEAGLRVRARPARGPAPTLSALLVQGEAVRLVSYPCFRTAGAGRRERRLRKRRAPTNARSNMKAIRTEEALVSWLYECLITSCCCPL